MKSVIQIIGFLILSLCPALGHAQDKDSEALPNKAKIVHWQENGVRRQAWLAADEVAVFRGKVKGKAAIARFMQDVNRSIPEKDIQFINSYVSVIRNQKLNAVQFASPRAVDNILRQAAPDSPARPVSPIFYPQGRKIPATRMALTGDIVVRFDSDPEADVLAAIEKNYSLTPTRSVNTKTRIYRAANPLQSLETANALCESGLVGEATPLWYRARATRQFEDPLAGQQWHLVNTGQGGGLPGEDANVAPVWATYRGSSSQVVAVVDGALEIGHEDLLDNVQPGLSWNFVEENDDPSGSSDDAHGTACAGIAVARGFNGIGIAGAAPSAGLAGLRLLGAETDLHEAEALSHHSETVSIYSNSWGPVDDGMRLEGPGLMTLQAIRDGAVSGRGGKGNIYVWAGGNGRQNMDNSNYDGYANLRETLAVGATTDQGQQADYSEPGANLLVNAPSNGGLSAITTTDRTGQSGYSLTSYTTNFGGTSAAAPLVSGIVALMLEANSNLTWRDVRWILAHTAKRNDPGHPDWNLNGAGLAVNHSYGFGRVDALAAVTMSAGFIGVGPDLGVQAVSQPNAAIPDNDALGITSSVEIADDFTVEFVDITFSAPDHPHWGDLEIVLTSPAGTESVLAQNHSSGRTHSYDKWRFGSTRHLGERSSGTWTLTVRDLWGQDTGTFTEWKLKIHGNGRNWATTGTAPLFPAMMLLLED